MKGIDIFCKDRLNNAFLIKFSFIALFLLFLMANGFCASLITYVDGNYFFVSENDLGRVNLFLENEDGISSLTDNLDINETDKDGTNYFCEGTGCNISEIYLQTCGGELYAIMSFKVGVSYANIAIIYKYFNGELKQMWVTDDTYLSGYSGDDDYFIYCFGNDAYKFQYDYDDFYLGPSFDGIKLCKSVQGFDGNFYCFDSVLDGTKNYIGYYSYTCGGDFYLYSNNNMYKATQGKLELKQISESSTFSNVLKENCNSGYGFNDFYFVSNDILYKSIEDSNANLCNLGSVNTSSLYDLSSFGGDDFYWEANNNIYKSRGGLCEKILISANAQFHEVDVGNYTIGWTNRNSGDFYFFDKNASGSYLKKSFQGSDNASTVFTLTSSYLDSSNNVNYSGFDQSKTDTYIFIRQDNTGQFVLLKSIGNSNTSINFGILTGNLSTSGDEFSTYTNTASTIFLDKINGEAFFRQDNSWKKSSLNEITSSLICNNCSKVSSDPKAFSKYFYNYDSDTDIMDVWKYDSTTKLVSSNVFSVNTGSTPKKFLIEPSGDGFYYIQYNSVSNKYDKFHVNQYLEKILLNDYGQFSPVYDMFICGYDTFIEKKHGTNLSDGAELGKISNGQITLLDYDASFFNQLCVDGGFYWQDLSQNLFFVKEGEDSIHSVFQNTLGDVQEIKFYKRGYSSPGVLMMFSNNYWDDYQDFNGALYYLRKDGFEFLANEVSNKELGYCGADFYYISEGILYRLEPGGQKTEIPNYSNIEDPIFREGVGDNCFQFEDFRKDIFIDGLGAFSLIQLDYSEYFSHMISGLDTPTNLTDLGIGGIDSDSFDDSVSGRYTSTPFYDYDSFSYHLDDGFFNVECSNPIDNANKRVDTITELFRSSATSRLVEENLVYYPFQPNPLLDGYYVCEFTCDYNYHKVGNECFPNEGLNSIFEEEPCVVEGGACDVDNSCCSGLDCVDGICQLEEEPCVVEGGACDVDNSCCSGLDCVDGICQLEEEPCVVEGGACDVDNSCCSGLDCVDGICKSALSCKNIDEYCSNECFIVNGENWCPNLCCPGLECINNECKIIENPNCLDDDEICGEDCTPLNDNDCLTPLNNIENFELKIEGDELFAYAKCTYSVRADLNLLIGEQLINKEIFCLENLEKNLIINLNELQDFNESNYKGTMKIPSPCNICQRETLIFLTKNKTDQNIIPDNNIIIISIITIFCLIILNHKKND